MTIGKASGSGSPDTSWFSIVNLQSSILPSSLILSSMPLAPQSLPRVLGPWMAIAIVVGNVIGTGVFKKGTKVAANAPEFGLGISVWIVGGVLVLLGALAMAEIAVRLPRAGGNYVYLREGFGRRAAF